MQLAENLELVNIYFINGEPPKHWRRNHIKDGPNGWHHAFVIDRSYIYAPASCEGWPVPENCVELEEAQELSGLEFDRDSTVARIMSSVKEKQRHGLPHDLIGANLVLRALGADTFKLPEEAREERKVKEEKPKGPTIKEKREGLKSIKDVETATGLKGRVIRGILRQAGIKKPDIGWAGDEKWYKEILKVIEGAQT